MYQRVGHAAYKADLSTTLSLMDMAGNPEKGLKCIHVAGTNGKGSVSHLCASVLQEAGYKVGLYTSPHLKDFRERIRVNGEVITEEMVVQFIDHYEDKFKDLKPSFFEMTVLLAFEYFNYSEVDIAVIETGMGGRLDSTNVVSPEVSVITNIGLDHTRFLGETVSAIAAEKAGIIKAGAPVVLGEMLHEAEEVIIAKAKEMGVDVFSTSEEEFEVPESDLNASYQYQNLRTAWLALYQLRKKGWPIQAKDLERGFSRVKENTGMRGRWETISTAPQTIVDCAHNSDGINGVMDSLRKEEFESLHVVFGAVDDKDLGAVLQLLPQEANYYFCKADIPRALDEQELHELASALGLKGEVFPTVKGAYEAARLYAKSDDLILITGSVFVVAEVL